MELVYFCLAAAGITQILVYGDIFKNQRNFLSKKSDFFRDLIQCSMCTGTWVGFFLFFLNGFTELFNFEYSLLNMLICGAIASISSYILDKVFGDNGININKGD